MLLALVMQTKSRLKVASIAALLLFLAPFLHAAPSIQIPRIDTPPTLADLSTLYGPALSALAPGMQIAITATAKRTSLRMGFSPEFAIRHQCPDEARSITRIANEPDRTGGLPLPPAGVGPNFADATNKR